MSEGGVPERFIKDTRSGLARAVGDKPIPHVIVDDFPGVDGRFKGSSFAIVAIDGGEEVRALGDAIAWLTSKEGGNFTREDFLTPDGEGALDYELMVRILYRSLRDPMDLTAHFAANEDELRATFFTDETHILFARHKLYQMQRSPFLRAKKWEEVRAKVEAVGKGSLDSMWLSSCANDTLRCITLELASRHYGRTKDSSSAT